MVNKDELKKGDIIRGIPYQNKGNTQEHDLEVLEIYEVSGKNKFHCFSLTDYISYPGFPDVGREITFTEEDLVNLTKID